MAGTILKPEAFHWGSDGSSTTDEDLPEVVRGLGVPAFVDAFVSRNVDILTPQEQAALYAMRVLVAGCGSVGGSLVEPLTRLGVGSLVLADPDRYDVTNLNRQACYLADVGRPKAEVLGERARAINPLVDVRVLREGLTTENMASALDGVWVVFDGVDPAPSAWEKYLLHKVAARSRIPIISGVDLGGKPTLFVFDYRRDTRPFYGRATAEGHRSGNFARATSWVRLTAFPPDFVPIFIDRIGTDKPWPQIAYCAAAMGALASRTILDVALGRSVPSCVTADIHALTQRRVARLRRLIRLPRALLHALPVARHAQRLSHVVRVVNASPPKLPRELLPVLQAVRLAPSAHNTQPWRLVVEGARRFRLAWDRGRWLDSSDPGNTVMAHSLGCAVAAAEAVAEIEFTPAPQIELRAADGHVGTVDVIRVREREYLRAAGVLGLRGTNRAPFLADPIAPDVLGELERTAGSLGTQLFALTDRRRIQRLAALTADGARQAMRDDAYLAELLQWIRLSRHEGDWDDDGFTAETLLLDPMSVRLIGLMKRSTRARDLLPAWGFARMIGWQAAVGIKRTGAMLLLCTDDTSPVGSVTAGRAMMQIWLAATRSGLAVQPVHFPLARDRLREEVVRLFQATPIAHAVTLLRIGRARSAAPPSQRLPLDRIVVGADGR